MSKADLQKRGILFRKVSKGLGNAFSQSLRQAECAAKRKAFFLRIPASVFAKENSERPYDDLRYALLPAQKWEEPHAASH